METALSATGINKSFGGSRVLHDFDIEIAPKEVHALLGHNGSGKSTFIKILAGFYKPDKDSGEIHVVELTLEAGNPQSGNDAGLAFVHQTLGLVPQLSVLENLKLGEKWSTSAFGKIKWRYERQQALKALDGFGLEVSPDAIIQDLTTVEQTEVAIVRALSAGDDIRVLVLDEPTAALTDREVRKLFKTLKRVSDHGVAILYVTHRLEEIEEIADRVTVLRDGRIVGDGAVGEFTGPALVSLISGPDSSALQEDDEEVFEQAAGTLPAADEAPRTSLVLRGVSAGELQNATFEAHAGEILGVVGLLGSGIFDLSEVLTSRTKLRSGTFELLGESIKFDDLATLRSKGYSSVVGSRGERVVMPFSVRENVTLAVLNRHRRHGFLSRRLEEKTTETAIERYEIRCSGSIAELSSLSGGNQQKVALAKSLQSDPQVLLLEEPCHGVDVNGRREIKRTLKQVASEGASVVVIDSDLEEVVGLCSRVLVFREGCVVSELRGKQITRRAMLDACYGAAVEN